MTDPAVRNAYRALRDAIARETAKLPAVDHNGQPIDPDQPRNVFMDAVERHNASHNTPLPRDI